MTGWHRQHWSLRFNKILFFSYSTKNFALFDSERNIYPQLQTLPLYQRHYQDAILLPTSVISKQ